MDKHEKKHKPKKGYFIAIALFSITLAITFFLQSTYFSLHEIRINGNNSLTDEEVLEQARVAFDVSIFEINVREATERLKQHPQVAHATISRQLPSTLSININERKPVALVPLDNGFGAIDAEGRILKRYDDLRLPLPLLTGLTMPANIGPGDFLNGEHVADALLVLSMMNQEAIHNMSEVRFTERGFALLTRENILVEVGAATQLADKFRMLRSLLQSIAREQRSVERIDLRVVQAPVVN